LVAEVAASPRGDRGKESHKRSKSHKEKSSKSSRHRDRDRVRDEGVDAEREEHRSRRSDRERDEVDAERDDRKSRRERGERERDRVDEVPREEKSSRHRDDRKPRSRSRERRVSRSDRRDEDDRERRSSHKRSRSRERRSSRHRSPSRHRSSSRRRDRDDGRRSRSRHRRSRSPKERRPRRAATPSDEEDGLGGYMPRKRQEPPREGVWSLAAAGYSGGGSYHDPYAALRSGKSLTPEEIKRQMQEQQLRARQLVLQQQASSAVAAASKTQREVYIGNLVGGMVTEDALRQLFNNTMAAAFPEQMVAGMDAVVNVSMHSEGRYAFVELRTPEMATAALQLSGQVQLLGQPISCGRPSGYVDPAQAQQAAIAAAKALEAFQKGEMSLEDAAQAGMPSAAPVVAQGTPAAAAAAVVAQAQAPGLPGPPPVPQVATQYLMVTGMVTAEVLADDEEYSEVIEDLRDECGKYGQIVAVTVPRPANPAESASLFGTRNFGKGFVHFADVEGAEKARDAIHGRLFAGITVQAVFIEAEAFAAAAE